MTEATQHIIHLYKINLNIFHFFYNQSSFLVSYLLGFLHFLYPYEAIFILPLAHSSTLPRLLSSSKFLFDPFPYLVLSSPSQTFPNRNSHDRSPLPSFQLLFNSHHPGFVPSIHQNNDEHHQRLPNQQASGLTDHPLSFSASPSTPIPGIFPLIVPHSEKAHHILSLSHSTVSSQIECLPLYL